MFWGNKNKKLIEAAEKGNQNTVRLLLANGADVNEKTRGGWTAFWTALMYAADKRPYRNSKALTG